MNADHETGLLAAEDRAELLPLAAGVFDWDAARLLQLVEIEEAATDGETLNLWLTEQERAAALIFRDDHLRLKQLNAASAEAWEHGQRLKATGTPAPNPKRVNFSEDVPTNFYVRNL